MEKRTEKLIEGAQLLERLNKDCRTTAEFNVCRLLHSRWMNG